jgi:hypothetical protein
MLAWQTRRGARHNAYSVNPKGAQAQPERSPQGTQRSVVNGAICNRMPRYVEWAQPISPGGAVPLRCRFQTDGEARRQARNERALLAKLDPQRGRCLPRRGWQYRAAADQGVLQPSPAACHSSSAASASSASRSGFPMSPPSISSGSRKSPPARAIRAGWVNVCTACRWPMATCV